MPKYVYVQLEGVDKPAKVMADSAIRETRSWQGLQGPTRSVRLVLKDGDVEVGEFNADRVIGWWFQEE